MRAWLSLIIQLPILVLAVAFAQTAIAQPKPQPDMAMEVDLELVLAVDISRSMDVEEQELQRLGYAEAFRHPQVIAAISSGLTGRIAVTFLEWAGEGLTFQRVNWTLIEGAESSFGFADAIATAPIGRHRRTSISAGLMTAAELLATSPFAGLREVIDVSGDGPNNGGLPVLEARQEVLRRGITINGLPIMLRPGGGFYNVHDLDIYYENCVIGGPGAFLLTVESADRFADAIRQKLVLEIAGRAPKIFPAKTTKVQADYDCLIGEKLRRRRMQELNWE